MGKTFEAAQLTHERFLTIDHYCKIFVCTAKLNFHQPLWCVVLYVTYRNTHQRSVEVQFARYQKNILQEWSLVKNFSCISCAAWNVFPINSLDWQAPMAPTLTQALYMYEIIHYYIQQQVLNWVEGEKQKCFGVKKQVKYVKILFEKIV